MFIVKAAILCSFIFLMIRSIRSIIRRERLISYSGYVKGVKAAITELNTDIVQVATETYQEAGIVVDVSALINRIVRLMGMALVFHPVIGAFIYQQSIVTVACFLLSMFHLIGDFSLEQIIVGKGKTSYFIIGYLMDHLVLIFNMIVSILMVIYL